MELKIENIGGLKGKHSFRFKKGLNFIAAKNGRGASSIIDGLRILIDPAAPPEVLFQGASRGTATLSIDGNEWHATVARTRAGVIVSPSELVENESPSLASMTIVDAHHPLAFWNLSPENVTSFLSTISYADKIASEVAKLTGEVNVAEADLHKLSEEVKTYDLAAYETVMEELTEVRGSKVALGKKLKTLRKPQAASRALVKAVEKARSERDFYAAQIEVMDKSISESSAKLEELDAQTAPLNIQREEMDVQLKLESAERDKHSSDAMVYEGVLKASEIRCPICSHLELSCGIEKLPQDIVRKSLLRALSASSDQKTLHGRKVEEMSESIREIKAKLHGLTASKSDAAQNIRRCQSNRKDYVNKHHEKELFLKGRLEKLEASNKEYAEYMKAQTELEVLEERDKMLEERRKQEFKALERARTANRRISELEKTLPKLKRDHDRKQRELDQKLNAARQLFNDAALEVMGKAGYLDLQGMHVDENFNLLVQRKGLKEPQMLSALSTSEQVSVAVLMSAWGKKAYCPKFPFFAFDTISTSYARDTFSTILGAILDASTYVIVTYPTAEVPEGIRILREIPA